MARRVLHKDVVAAPNAAVATNYEERRKQILLRWI